MNKLIAIFFYIFLGLVSNNCVEPISFPLPDDDGFVAIYGRITNLDGPHYVTIYRSNTPKKDPQPITNAVITLFEQDGQSTSSFSFVQERPGKYKLIGLNKGIPGKSYHIEVVLNNKVYKSEVEVMPNVIGTDSLYYEISKDISLSKDGSRYYHQLFVKSKANLPELKYNYYLRWVVDEVYFMPLTFFPNPFNTPPPDCFAGDRVDPDRITLLEKDKFNGVSIDLLLAQREIDYTFKSRHYIIVTQLSTTQSSYRYWSAVKTLLANSGSPFDVPPARIQGNLGVSDNSNELVLGYFEACAASSDRFFLVPGFIPYYLEPFCEYKPEKPQRTDYPPVCIRCENLPNYSYEQPPWF